MIILDTSVLVYAKGAGHRFRDPCRALIGAVTDGRIEATTTVEVVQEFVQVRARRRSRSDAVALGRAYAELLAPLLTPTGADLLGGLAIFQAAERLGAFDAVLASVAIGSGADALVSTDAAFGEVPGLRQVVPDELSVARLLNT
ncbi:MAG TPA: type II toxin-antitoxin system VapC family toxin [Microlunatus sp.]|nr:type II toxin-antitoxin system VapC family toxin [Microlunatus sp.]